ncbi:MAG: ABC transporter ATP-binding protein [Thermoplasmata archaeon]
MVKIRIENLTKNYGNVEALKSVNLTFDREGIMVLLGPNGAGKTTLMKTMTGISRPTSGDIFINEHSVREDLSTALGSIGSLVEQPEFYPYLTGREILNFSCRIRGLTRSECTQRIDEVSRLTGCFSYLDRKAGEYSRGMKQRLGLSLSLLHDPPIMILDEPTFGLDPKGMYQFRNILKDINAKKEKIIILSTHLISEAKEVGDRIIIINNGSIVSDFENTDAGYVRIRVDGSKDSVVLRELASDHRLEEGYLFLRPDEDIPGILKKLVLDNVRFDRVEEYSDLENQYIRSVGDS